MNHDDEMYDHHNSGTLSYLDLSNSLKNYNDFELRY